MEYTAKSNGPVRNGEPVATRRDAFGFDAYDFPNGLRIQVYDDGRIKVGRWNRGVQVLDVSNYSRGASNASAHVVMRFGDETGAATEDEGEG